VLAAKEERVNFKELLVKQNRWDAGMARHMVGVLTDDLSEDELNWQARSGHHSIWHHIWHMFLSNDYYSAEAFGMPAVWDQGKWRERIDLAPMARVFDYPGKGMGLGLESTVPRFVIFDVPDSLVDELKAPPLEQYMAYVDDLLATTASRLDSMSEERLLERVPWYGRRAPLYSVALGFGHVSRHIGMMEDVRGLIRGPGAGTASI
jgi:hypothetical protein